MPQKKPFVSQRTQALFGTIKLKDAQRIRIFIPKQEATVRGCINSDFFSVGFFGAFIISEAFSIDPGRLGLVLAFHTGP